MSPRTVPTRPRPPRRIDLGPYLTGPQRVLSLIELPGDLNVVVDTFENGREIGFTLRFRIGARHAQGLTFATHRNDDSWIVTYEGDDTTGDRTEFWATKKDHRNAEEAARHVNGRLLALAGVR